jgi:hypothetical protein
MAYSNLHGVGWDDESGEMSEGTERGENAESGGGGQAAKGLLGAALVPALVDEGCEDAYGGGSRRAATTGDALRPGRSRCGSPVGKQSRRNRRRCLPRGPCRPGPRDVTRVALWP